MWYWWVTGHIRLTPNVESIILNHRSEGLGVSIISCWELAKKVEVGKLQLDRGIDEWLDIAASVPGVELLELTLPIVVEST
jgi:PIN domain nuclease of toxin-antitoxin system